MNTLASLYASASGLWAKIALILPKLSGLASVLTGAGMVVSEAARAQNAGQLLALAQNFHHDPGVGLIVAGLTALGYHAHQQAILAAVTQAAQPCAPAAGK